MNDQKSRRRLRSPAAFLGYLSASIVVIFAGALMAVPFLPRNEPPRPSAYSYVLGDFRAAAQMRTETSGNFVLELALSAAGAPGDPADLSASVTMVGHKMLAKSVELVKTGVGTYRATGLLDAPGRWQLSVSSGDDTFAIVVDHLASF